MHVYYLIIPSNKQALEKANAEVTKELAKFDREDVQLQEKKKHKVQKQKKLQKAAQSSKLSHAEATTWIINHTEEVEKHTEKLAELESNLAVEEKELDSIRDALKGDILYMYLTIVKTQGFSDQIEKKQKSLEPWTAQINEKQAAIALTQSELDLIREKESQSLNAIEEVQAKIKTLASDKANKVAELKQSQKELGAIEKQTQDASAQLKNCQQKGAKLYEALSQSRGKAEEAKASLSASQTQGQVLTSLTRLKDSGRIQGFHVVPSSMLTHDRVV